jgi:hypothetical protein
VNIVTPASPERVKERPAKRAKVDAAVAGNIVRSGPPKRGRASCLSELPTMPLDILFEVCSFRLVIQVTSEGHVKIFSHLHPSDLLSLSRVNKEFRSQLLSSGFCLYGMHALGYAVPLLLQWTCLPRHGPICSLAAPTVM